MERSLAWRLGLSAVLIPALIGLFALDHSLGEPAPVLFTLCLFLTIRSAWEAAQLLTVRNIRPQFATTAAGCILILMAAWWSRLGAVQSPFTSLEMTLDCPGGCDPWFVRCRSHSLSQRQGSSMESLGGNLLIVCYCGILLVVTAQLRWAKGADAGYLLLGSLVITAKMGDIGAYTLGRLFGKTKMAPHLSPGKTWAGFGGALIGASLGSLLWLTFAPPLFDESWHAPPVWASLLFGVAIGITGLAGDLCESLIKRDVGQKDSAPLMPGFGGLLDLLDSVLYAGPVALLLWHVLPLAMW